MLILPLKPSVRYDLGSALARWLDDSSIQVAFQPTNPLQFVLPKPDFSSSQCSADLQRLQSLRNCLTDVFLKSESHKHALNENDGGSGALDDCYEYHAALLEFEKRGFPTLDDECSGISIKWKGAFDNKQEKHSTLIWDRVCVTYNIVALLTDKINDLSINDRADCKQAVALCQQGASLFAVLKELVPSQDFSTVDLCMPLLNFWEKFLLAQGQNYVYRMVVASGGDKHPTLSLLSQSAHQLYNEALSVAQDPRLQSEISRESNNWAAYCKANSMLHAARSAYHQSVVHRLSHEWGYEIGRLQECMSKLESCRTFLSSLDSCDDGPGSDDVTEFTKRECDAIYPVVRDRLQEANQDNYKIYQDTVPTELSDLQSKQLVKLNPTLPQNMITPKKPLFVGL